MSFVFAEKNIEKIDSALDIERIQIMSDTKLSLYNNAHTHFSDVTYNNIQQFGIIKSIIIGPNCCVSFAGNNILLANQLIQEISKLSMPEVDQVTSLAYTIHMNAPSEDDIEFIIAYSDSALRIDCIKERKKMINVPSAWIGSYTAFRKMQELRSIDTSPFDSASFFQQAVNSCGDDSVGGFCITVQCSCNTYKFKYCYKYFTSIEKSQFVLPGEAIRLYDSAADGGFTYEIKEADGEVLIDFHQKPYSVLFTRKYRRTAEEIANKSISHFLLPTMLKRTDKGGYSFM